MTSVHHHRLFCLIPMKIELIIMDDVLLNSRLSFTSTESCFIRSCSVWKICICFKLHYRWKISKYLLGLNLEVISCNIEMLFGIGAKSSGSDLGRNGFFISWGKFHVRWWIINSDETRKLRIFHIFALKVFSLLDSSFF